MSMTLDKAIELGKDFLLFQKPSISADQYDAIMILVEAGKRIQCQRKDLFRAEIKPLPGETEE